MPKENATKNLSDVSYNHLVGTTILKGGILAKITYVNSLEFFYIGQELQNLSEI